MRSLILVAGVAMAALLADAPAANAAWCANYDNGGRNCGFSSQRQCLRTVSGVGGMCEYSPGRRAGWRARDAYARGYYVRDPWRPRW